MFDPDKLPAVRVPSSTSNLGAGFDCLGLALDLWLEAKIATGSGPPRYGGSLAGFDPNADFTANALGNLLPDGYHLEVNSDIPVSRGLGSSAAAIVAGSALAHVLSRGTLDREAVFEEASSTEGHPDNAGPAVFGGLFLYAGAPEALTFHRDLGVAIAVPEQVLSTDEARGILPQQLSREDTIGQASSAAALLLGLTTGNSGLIRRGMIDRIAVPSRKSLIVGYDEAVRAGIEAGAYGVTISGAGSTLVAICAKDATGGVAEAIAQTLTTLGNPAEALCPDVVENGMEMTA